MSPWRMASATPDLYGYLPSFGASPTPSTITKLYCLVTAAGVRQRLVQGCTRQRSGWDSNPRPFDHHSYTFYNQASDAQDKNTLWKSGTGDLRLLLRDTLVAPTHKRKGWQCLNPTAGKLLIFIRKAVNIHEETLVSRRCSSVYAAPTW